MFKSRILSTVAGLCVATGALLASPSARALDICGTVTINGQPAANIKVAAFLASNGAPVASTTSSGAAASNFRLVSPAAPNTAVVVVFLAPTGCCITLDAAAIQLGDQGGGRAIVCPNIPCYNPGTGTPGYWKNHPDAWPVDRLSIGGVVYTKRQILTLLGTPDGDKRYTLFRALVAAKLNCLIGNDVSCISSFIANADVWLCLYVPATGLPNGTAIAGSSPAWRGGEPLYLCLDAYNNGQLCAPHRK